MKETEEITNKNAIEKPIGFYSIRTLTNLHVGSGETSYGVVDNLVQRDVNSKLPTIHSSSLKGALKEYFRHSDPSVLRIFGDADQAGTWQFLSADMLSRPLRSDKTPYFNATSPQVIKSLIRKFRDFNFEIPTVLEEFGKIEVKKNVPIVFDKAFEGALIEELDWVAKWQDPPTTGLGWIKEVFGENLVLVDSDDFQELELPVIARNYLDNGESKNLWYEEVVPYDSRFGTFIISTADHQEGFLKGLQGHIQIGANASIGYGLCKIIQYTNPEKS